MSNKFITAREKSNSLRYRAALLREEGLRHNGIGTDEEHAEAQRLEQQASELDRYPHDAVVPND